jgi:hypothetical protein
MTMIWRITFNVYLCEHVSIFVCKCFTGSSFVYIEQFKLSTYKKELRFCPFFFEFFPEGFLQASMEQFDFIDY